MIHFGWFSGVLLKPMYVQNPGKFWGPWGQMYVQNPGDFVGWTEVYVKIRGNPGASPAGPAG
jgi:hypothetical protein